MNVGLSIRLESTLENVYRKAEELQLTTFQTFFNLPNGGFYRATADEARIFSHSHTFLKQSFLHCSYGINLASNQVKALPHLKTEIEQALKLEFNYLVLHPGARSALQTREQALDLCAKQLNALLKKYPDVCLLLENIAHGKKALGGDLTELRMLLEKSDRPEQLFYCIDTAHAYAWGYPTGKELVNTLASTIPLDHIKLIHLNDSLEPAGSKLDRHAAPGKGLIGSEALCAFIQHPAMRALPKILELPSSEDQNAVTLLRELSKE